MSSLLDERALTSGERKVYSAVLRDYKKTASAAPNLIISLDGLDSPGRAKV